MKIVIHCSDSPQGRGDNAETIHKWHTDPNKPGGPFSGIGYHHVILEDGKRQSGRPEYWAGAHAKGHNLNSVGICLIGRHSFTRKQFKTLKRLVKNLKRRYPGAKVYGHYELDPGKTCPNFDVPEWLVANGIAP